MPEELPEGQPPAAEVFGFRRREQAVFSGEPLRRGRTTSPVTNAAAAVMSLYWEARGRGFSLKSLADRALEDSERSALIELQRLELVRAGKARRILGQVWGIQIGTPAPDERREAA